MNLAFSSFGSGPPLVLIHGLFGSGDNLRGIGRSFESQYTVYYPDLPNHGDSPHTDSTAWSVLSAALAELLERQDAAPAIVAGHSMGGKVAMRLALDRPDLVTALVILDMAPRSYDPSHHEIIDAMLELPTGEVENRADADRRLSEAIPSRPVRSFLLKNLVKDGEGYRWRLNLPLIEREYATILGWEGSGTYDGPALFIGGSDSKYVKPARDTELIRGYFPSAEIEMIDGVGHWIHSERPDEVERLVRQFLSERASGGEAGAGARRGESR